MANVEMRFLCESRTGSYIKVKETTYADPVLSVIHIAIFDLDNKEHLIILDKSTAIKFAKTIRTEINKMVIESEAKNG